MEDDELKRTTLFRGRALPSRNAAHALILRREGFPPRRIPVLPGTFTVGRDPANSLVLQSSEVSRRHCGIHVAEFSATLTDFSSTNGVYLDGHRVSGAIALHPGARIGVGQFNLSYQRGTAEELAEAETNERELSQAVDYVRAILPVPLRQGSVRAEWRFVPSASIGGDVFGYRWLDDGRFSVYLLDVCGHGVGSALLAVSAANMLRTAGQGIDFGDPMQVLHALNAAFQMEEHHGLFFTIWYGVFNPVSRLLTYASAGHHPAYLQNAKSLEALVTRAPAIGMAPTLASNSRNVALQPGARIYLFSDGAFEATRADGEPMTIKDLIGLYDAAPRGEAGINQIHAGLRELIGFRPFDDDLSLLLLDFT